MIKTCVKLKAVSFEILWELGLCLLRRKAYEQALMCRLFLSTSVNVFSNKSALGVKLLKIQYRSPSLLTCLLLQQPSANYLEFPGCHQGPSAFPTREEIANKQSL